MNVNSFVLNHVLAQARYNELLQEAEQNRLVRQAGQRNGRGAALATIVAAGRHLIGTALVRAGHRLQGAGRANPADAVPSVTSLRLAR